MADIKKKLVDGAGLQAAMGIMADFADKGVRGAIGGYNQSFPLTAATKGNIYYHKGTNRYYICVDNYNGSSLTNPNSKFEELSVYTNRQRLDNYYAKQEIDSKVNLLESTKADKTTKIIVGDGLLGTGSLESKINITVDNLSDEEIQSLMTNWR